MRCWDISFFVFTFSRQKTKVCSAKTTHRRARKLNFSSSKNTESNTTEHECTIDGSNEQTEKTYNAMPSQSQQSVSGGNSGIDKSTVAVTSVGRNSCIYNSTVSVISATDNSCIDTVTMISAGTDELDANVVDSPSSFKSYIQKKGVYESTPAPQVHKRQRSKYSNIQLPTGKHG